MRWPIVMGGGPASRANAQRNARGTPARLERWTPARDALWAVLDRYVADGARVAVVGAGNGHDVPLRRLAGRAARVDLIDLDARAARAARGRLPGDLRGHVEVVREDVTAGVADELVRKAAAGAIPDVREAPAMPLGAGRYDVVVGDLLYSQLLYPALRDSALPRERVGVVLARIDRPLVASVVRRLHLSAPGGVVVHVHDPLGWWADHPQPVALEAILAAAQAGDLAAAHELVAQGRGPTACDPLAIALEAGIEPVETVFWRWPFQEGVDYLARATVTRPGGASLH
jgi:SAM-dependent methyltransferase